jgi:tRNA(Glu) U13 pseudouridine synthase TruD
MQWQLEKHASLNLANEYTLVKRITELRNIDDAIRELKKDITGLWVGAYQGYWFNRALEKVLSGEVQVNDGRIPLYIKEKTTEDWYRRHNLGNAIVDPVDPFVLETFLTPPQRFKRAKSGHAFNRRGAVHRDFRPPETPGPRRNAMIRVSNFKHDIEDGLWKVNFELESGGYATSVLQMFVDLDTGDEVVSDERASS